jgi:hypothetical protein
MALILRLRTTVARQTSSEMSQTQSWTLIHIVAYNMKRVMRILGVGGSAVSDAGWIELGFLPTEISHAVVA